MIHFLPLPPKQKRRCDTTALANARANVIADLTSNKLEKEFDARLPRHFSERQAYLQNGETS